jgi:hypothetical protein
MKSVIFKWSAKNLMTHLLPNKEVREVFGHFGRLARSGMILGLVLSAFSFFGDGAKEAAEELLSHSLNIHPFLWAASPLLVCSFVLLQNADISAWIDGAFAKPLLELFSHLYSVGFGALLLLQAFAVGRAGGFACGQLRVIVAELAVLLVFGTLSVAGLLIIEKRNDFRKRSKACAVCTAEPHVEPPNGASETQLKLYFFLWWIVLLGSMATLQWRGTAEEILKQPIEMLKGQECKRMSAGEPVSPTNHAVVVAEVGRVEAWSSEQSTAAATAALVVVTAILAWATYKLYKATVKLGEDSFNIAKDAHATAQASFLATHKPQIILRNPAAYNSDRKDGWLGYSLVNTGGSSATVFEPVAGVSFEKPSEALPILKPIDVSKAARFTIQAGEEVIYKFDLIDQEMRDIFWSGIGLGVWAAEGQGRKKW